MTRWAATMRVVADYTVGTVIVVVHFIMVGIEQRSRGKPHALGA